MAESNKKTPPNRLVNLYLLFTILTGGGIFFLAAYRLDPRIIDLKLAVLTLLTLSVCSRITIAIRQRNASVPIAVITGWGEAVGSDEQKQARVDWVVTKPFRAERISELAQEIRKRRKVSSKKSTLAEAAA